VGILFEKDSLTNEKWSREQAGQSAAKMDGKSIDRIVHFTINFVE
jgi:hypothetical protein